MEENNVKQSELLKITDPSEFFKKTDELLQDRLRNISKLFAENKVIVQQEGQWSIDLGTESSFEEAFGPASAAEIEANNKIPLSQILANLTHSV